MKFTIEEISTPSNFLSMLRLFLAIPLWYLFDYISNPHVRLIIFIICIFAAVTDILDGYIARKYDQVTEFGKIIDPLADKITVGAIIIKLFLLSEIPVYYFMMILVRDVLIFLGGIYVAKRIGKVLPSNILGKMTVVNISLVILSLVAGIGKGSYLFLSLYYLSIVLIIVSFIAYVIRAKEFLKRKEYESV